MCLDPVILNKAKWKSNLVFVKVLSIQDGSGTEIEVPKDKQGGAKAPIYIKGTFSGTQVSIFQY